MAELDGDALVVRPVVLEGSDRWVTMALPISCGGGKPPDLAAPLPISAAYSSWAADCCALSLGCVATNHTPMKRANSTTDSSRLFPCSFFMAAFRQAFRMAKEFT
jgi:hypothetical protein